MARWMPVKGYEEQYLVSDEGEVLSLRRKVFNGKGFGIRQSKFLKPGLRGKNGHYYKFVILSNGEVVERKAVHRLVAEAFLPNPDNLPEVNHKDENRLNNHVENLEWCTREYNAGYSKNKAVLQFCDGEQIAEYKSIKVASQQTGISRNCISNALRGRAMSAGGYQWYYKTKGEMTYGTNEEDA